MSISNNILIKSESKYVADQSQPDKNKFVFSYTITIVNQTNEIIQLMSRHWLIKDSNYKIEEVIGDGVVGEQPVLQPNQGFQYSSGAILETDVGTMEGFYHFKDQLNKMIEVPIPLFVLSIPRKLHYFTHQDY